MLSNHGLTVKLPAPDLCIGLVEPKGVINTGDTGGDLTANNDVWV